MTQGRIDAYSRQLNLTCRSSSIGCTPILSPLFSCVTAGVGVTATASTKTTTTITTSATAAAADADAAAGAARLQEAPKRVKRGYSCTG